uniref:Kazrin isoform X5 n=1 Tax=Pogona vitticeps TaxID=103695 RepID=A0ABM5EL76_9SAUR
MLLREEVSQLQEEVHLLRQMKDMLTKDLEETHGGKSTEILSAIELKVQLAQKEQELARAKEALQAMKADRKRLKGEKTDLVSQMQQLYATLESREEQLRDFIRNYEQHRKESEDVVKALAKEKDLLEREKWELRRQAKEATDHASALRSQLDLKDNRMKELEAELAMAKQSLATLTKDVPKRHSLAMPGETVLNGNQEWVMQADLPLTAAIRQSQQTLYHAHPQHTVDRQAVRVSPCHSRQPSIISDASATEGDRSSTPSDINSPRHRTHSLCNVRRLCRSLAGWSLFLTRSLAGPWALSRGGEVASGAGAASAQGGVCATFFIQSVNKREKAWPANPPCPVSSLPSGAPGGQGGVGCKQGRTKTQRSASHHSLSVHPEQETFRSSGEMVVMVFITLLSNRLAPNGSRSWGEGILLGWEAGGVSSPFVTHA